jgi:hypothetical protein
MLYAAYLNNVTNCQLAPWSFNPSAALQYIYQTGINHPVIEKPLLHRQVKRTTHCNWTIWDPFSSSSKNWVGYQKLTIQL